MKIIKFTLQDASDFVLEADGDIQSSVNGEYTVANETALALLIYNRFPELRECHRRIKQLIVVDETGEKYETEDFSVPGSLRKTQNN